jgi:hypothetical protein
METVRLRFGVRRTGAWLVWTELAVGDPGGAIQTETM